MTSSRYSENPGSSRGPVVHTRKTYAAKLCFDLMEYYQAIHDQFTTADLGSAYIPNMFQT